MIYEFKCPDGHVVEHMLPLAERNVPRPCNVCGKKSKRIPSRTNFALDPVSGHFPTATDKFEKEHEAAGKRSDPV